MLTRTACVMRPLVPVTITVKVPVLVVLVVNTVRMTEALPPDVRVTLPLLNEVVGG
jgi:hypothetical protein